MSNEITKNSIENAVSQKLIRYFGISDFEEASKEEIYMSLILSIKDILNERRSNFNRAVKKKRAKRVYYLCMEFLIGKSLKNNICNLGIEDTVKEILTEKGIKLEDLYEFEPDAALGNGGLGRLGACYMDALSSGNYPATGFSILYEYGLFKQKIVLGEQAELPDEWMTYGGVWLTARTDRAYTVRFGGKVKEFWREDGKCDIVYEDCEEVEAVPYDYTVSGYNTECVNSIRLWKAVSKRDFNMSLVSQGQYVRALEEKGNSEIISKVLYPSDNHTEGKLLRLTQQYFLVSASLQSIIFDHLKVYGSLENFADKVAIHINDTHPALIIPEMMRVLIDNYGYTWEDAWRIVSKTVSYTNHTVMSEALECWSEDIFKIRLPRLYTIVSEINRRLCKNLWASYPGDWEKISRMSIINSGSIRMAQLCVSSSCKINGVSELHTEILKKNLFYDYYKYTPEKFINITNGIAYRRWLCFSNPRLSELLDLVIGNSYRTDASKLTEFKNYENDKSVLLKLADIKYNNKTEFSNWLKSKTGQILDPNTVFDIQVKRMHEYKRQLLNILNIISTYVDLLNTPNMDIVPQTYIFAAKAPPNYYMAKQLIKLIVAIENEINKHPIIKEQLNVVFVENYNVSVAEKLIPCCEISEQISLAGKEASGTGNMKQMINGGVTIGTLDGANVEIKNEVGEDNIYIFGHTAKEAEELWRQGYNSILYYNKCYKLKNAIDFLASGFNDVGFVKIADYLISGGNISDPYMCLADFDSYYKIHHNMLNDYRDTLKWQKKSLNNIAKAGIFSADRSISEYANKVWGLLKV
ncbi:MAG: glycogen/starch/alpha-glucan family phosphorylase [Clostridia bacterium]|nr:glycogen/starch/alpha-glucan family phosphorylase [Clostridia bacterium]